MLILHYNWLDGDLSQSEPPQQENYLINLSDSFLELTASELNRGRGPANLHLKPNVSAIQAVAGWKFSSIFQFLFLGLN